MRYLSKVYSNTSHFAGLVPTRSRKKLSFRRNLHKFRSKILFDCIREMGATPGEAFRADRYGLYNISYEALIFDVTVDTQFDRKFQTTARPDNLFSDFLGYRDGTEWYTDGSRTETGGITRAGCSSYAPDMGIIVSRGMDSRASIFTMESVAFRDVVKMARRFPGRNALVVFDSLSALDTLRTRKFGVGTNPYFLEIKKLCSLFDKDSSCQFSVNVL